jgi:(p)ppGpp synthase/HD superfamily hydrolase
MIIWTPRLLRARDFARKAHDSIGHIRKYSRVPYWHHTERTMARLSIITQDEDLLIGQLFHDIIEDIYPKNSDYSPDAILNLFGARATSHMLDLTDVYTKEAYPYFNRKQRKELEVMRLALVPIMSKNGKLVDNIDNTEDILHGDKGFARTYLKEIYELLQVLKDGDKEAWQEAMKQVLAGFLELEITIPANAILIN